MINLFFDCEFTHLPNGIDSVPPVLISIGVVSEVENFYAENSDTQLELASDFTRVHVLPLLEGVDKCMPYPEIAKRLRVWIETLGDEVKMWTDSPYHDWPFIQHMFDCHGWPRNLVRKPIMLTWVSSIQTQRFKAAVEDIFRSQPDLRRHHALDDALVNMQAFRRATARRY